MYQYPSMNQATSDFLHQRAVYLPFWIDSNGSPLAEREEHSPLEQNPRLYLAVKGWERQVYHLHG